MLDSMILQKLRKTTHGELEIKITKDLLTMFNSKIPKGSGTMIILQNFDLDVFSTRKDNMKKSIIGYCERTYCEKIAVKSLKLIVDDVSLIQLILYVGIILK